MDEGEKRLKEPGELRIVGQRRARSTDSTKQYLQGITETEVAVREPAWVWSALCPLYMSFVGFVLFFNSGGGACL